MLFLAYNLLYPLLALAFVAGLAFSRRRDLLKTFPRELRERLGLYPPPEGGRPVVWIHAASVGEVRALPKIVEALRAGADPPAVWITTSTAAGKAVASGLEADRVLLAPLDFYPLARRCLGRVRPKGLLIAETELWPSLLRSAAAAGARIIILNGRVTERSARGYRWIKSLLRLDLIDLACVQTEDDRGRFVALGADPSKVRVVGNLKHDFLPEDLAPSPAVLERLKAAGWGSTDRTFVAGSTHPVEEDAVIGAFLAARLRVPGLRLVLAPRHVERSREIEADLTRRGLPYALWSGGEGRAAGAEVLLVDRTGVLTDIYRAADAVFVGGSLVNIGGHNIMEPAALSKPTIFGPFVSTVASVAKLLVESGGGFQVKDGAELEGTLEGLLSRPDLSEAGRRAREACRSLGGATQRTMELVAPLLR